MTALIDADSFLYKVGFALEETFENEDGTEYHVVDLINAKDALDGLIDGILFSTDCDDYELWLTGKENFRYQIATDGLKDAYKHNRKDSRKPDKFQEMWNYLRTVHKAKLTPFCEADDVVVVKKTEAPDDYLLCAIDKDVLYQTEGRHYNYGKDVFAVVTKEEALHYAYLQTLTGDTTDGYKGAYRIGPKKAAAILGEPGDFDERQLWARVLSTYRKCKQTKKEALATMRLAQMHQLKRVTGKLKLRLWTPPAKGECQIDALQF
jgi:DNA polymerase-1